jgi:hypothetical protein
LATLQDVFDIAIELLDKRDGGGNLDVKKIMNLKAKAPLLSSLLLQELAVCDGTDAPEELMRSFSEEMPLSNFAALAVMPYGLAALLAIQGGDKDLSSYLKGEYEMQKKKIKQPSNEIGSTTDTLDGLTGRC